MTIYEDLSRLKLNYLSENLDQFLAQAAKAGHGPKEVITRLTELELIEKSRRSTDRRLKNARLGQFKSMAEFDWKWPKEIERKEIEELFSCAFVQEKKNVVIAGPQGLGKTMLSRNLALSAVMSGYSAVFVTAARLIMDLGSQESTAALERRFKRYEKPHLLAIDEIGYVSFDSKAADFLFEIVNRRYEKGTMVMTTNLAFKDWYKIFPGSPCLTAMIDRLTHHCEILKIDGDSWRLKESSARKKDKKGGKADEQQTMPN